MTKITLALIVLMLIPSCKPGAKSEQDVRNSPDHSSNVGAEEKSNTFQLSAQSHQECELKYGRVEDVDEFEYSNGLCIYIVKDSEEYPVLLKRQDCLDKNFQISSTLSDEVAVCWAKLKVAEEKPNEGVNGECVIEFHQPIDKLRYSFQNEEMSKILSRCQQLVDEQNIENQERTIKTISTLMSVDSVIGYDNKKVSGECVFEFNEPIDKLRYPFQSEDFSLVQSKCEQLVEMQSIENQERTLKSVTAFVYGDEHGFGGEGDSNIPADNTNTKCLFLGENRLVIGDPDSFKITTKSKGEAEDYCLKNELETYTYLLILYEGNYIFNSMYGDSIDALKQSSKRGVTPVFSQNRTYGSVYGSSC